MDFKIIPAEDYETLYKNMQHDFPKPGELAPYHAIKRNLDNGKYTAFYLYDDIVPVGYMVVTIPEDSRLVFGNYFAIYPELRSKSYGTAFLSSIINKYPDRSFVIEVSDPAAEDNMDIRDISIKRVKFYERAGFAIAPTVKSKIFGADMLIMVTNLYEGFSAREAMLSLYMTPAPSEFWLSNIDVIDA